jgi:hypothetical protein
MNMISKRAWPHACLALSMCACMPFVRGGQGDDTDPVTPPALLRAPDPLLGITQSYSQHAAIDSIRAMYRAQIAAEGRLTRENWDEIDNLVRRELVDLRAVLTPDQALIFDRHVAAALTPPAPASDLDH